MAGTKYVSYVYETEGKKALSTVDEYGRILEVRFEDREFREFLNGNLEEAAFIYGDKEIVFKKPVLDKVQIEITEKCNLKCPFCYVGDKEGREVPEERAFEMLGEFRDLGVKIVEISGGEPFLCGYLRDFAKEANKMGFYTVLFTNGTLLDEKTAKFFDRIQISYDGPEYLHEEYRGVKLDIKKAVEASKRARRIDIATVVYEKTRVFDLYNLYLELKDLEITGWGLSPPVPAGGASKLKKRDLLEIYMRIKDFKYILSKKDPDFYKKMLYKSKRRYVCPAGRAFIYITADLKIKPCPLVDVVIGEAVEKLRWKEFKEFERYERFCSSCDGCEQPCPAYRFYYGSISNPWCKVAHKPYRLFEHPLFFDFYVFVGRENRERELEIIKKALYGIDFRKLVDFGCGKGDLTYLIAREFGNAKITGVDSSKMLIQTAMQKYSLKNLSFIHSDALEYAKNMEPVDVSLLWWGTIIGYDYPWKEFLKILSLKTRYLLVDIPGEFSGGKAVGEVDGKKFEYNILNELNFLDVYENEKLIFSTAFIYENLPSKELEKILSECGFRKIKGENGKRRVWLLKSTNY